MISELFSKLCSDIQDCTNCDIHICNHMVPEGTPNMDIMFVAESIGNEEERAKELFVGPSGTIIDNMLEAAADKLGEKWKRENVYITNVIKCRPPNREPSKEEIDNCRKFLYREIVYVNPKIIICLGNVAANELIHPGFRITKQHGILFGEGPVIMAIYHPSYILHKRELSPEGINAKREMWADLVKANDYLDSIEGED